VKSISFYPLIVAHILSPFSLAKSIYSSKNYRISIQMLFHVLYLYISWCNFYFHVATFMHHSTQMLLHTLMHTCMQRKCLRQVSEWLFEWVFEEMDFPGFALNDLCRFYTTVVENFFTASPSSTLNFIFSQIIEWENKLGKF
jgi:hypothetical protein